MNSVLLAITILNTVAALVAAVCAWLSLRKRADGGGPSREIADKLLLIETAVQAQPGHLREELRSLRETSDTRAAGLRQELGALILGFQQALETRFTAASEELTKGQVGAANAVEKSTKAFSDFQRERLDRMEQAQKAGLEAVASQLKEMRDAAAAEAARSRQALAEQMEQLRKENEAKLEQMRATVDEKLQGTLEKRLGESFQLVSERLETVHKGLGEMQQLATGVGDLKRVLTNVKSRGGWGEVQLGALLDEMLAPEQFERNCAVDPASGQRVEFAVRMPGQADGAPVLLPIDAKFPHEDYERLLSAQEAGDPAAVEAASKALERAVRLQAKTICDAYVRPPHTTDFAIMYLPTEGLYAEVARRPGIVRDLQTSCRVMVAGPSNLAAFLNSLQMGFRTLAIQKRSSEVWQVLAAAKAEFQKYGEVWDKLGKQLDTARKTVDEAGKRTRAVERKLRGVETLETVAAPEAPKLLTLTSLPEEDEAA
jgi:DNA recombination protein RmuC